VALKTVFAEGEVEIWRIPQRHGVCAALVPVRRDGGAGAALGERQNIRHRQARQVRVDHQQMRRPAGARGGG